MKIIENTSLKNYNTFGIDVQTRYLCFYKQPFDLLELITDGPLHRDMEMIILGRGSNQLFTKNFDGVVIHPINDDIKITGQDENFVFVKAGAGLEWDKLVVFAVENGWGGIENLSDIPGTVGAAPVQNIGAYGSEAKDSIYEVHLVSFHDGSLKTLSNNDCRFSYRNSIFKNEFKNRYLVDSVTFKLHKNPTFNIEYGALEEEVKKLGDVSLENIRKAVISIRDQKLPKPVEIGNAGSFFKNPVIPECEAIALKKAFPGLPVYPAEPGMTKLAAGWMIEQCGMKGYKLPNGAAGVHQNQALVLVNFGNATGTDIIQVAKQVQIAVFEKFDINLEPEVIING